MDAARRGFFFLFGLFTRFGVVIRAARDVSCSEKVITVTDDERNSPESITCDYVFVSKWLHTSIVVLSMCE